MEAINKVLANVEQGLTETEKAQARANIGAVSSTEVNVAIAAAVAGLPQQTWTFEEMPSRVEWNSVGVGTWRSLKSVQVPAGKHLSITVQGIASWDADTGEGLAVLQLGPNDAYMSSGYYGRTTLCGVWPNAATGNAYNSFGQTLHWTNTTDADATVYLGAYNLYGIGSNHLVLTSASPSDQVGPNIQWSVY